MLHRWENAAVSARLDITPHFLDWNSAMGGKRQFLEVYYQPFKDFPVKMAFKVNIL